jgi:hypothetical protein
VDRLIFGAVHVRSRVIDEDGDAVEKIAPGQSYGHGIEIVKNYALWPYDLNVQTVVQNNNQLAFIDHGTPKPSWGFKSFVPANHGIGEHVMLLGCIAKVTNKDFLSTTVTFGGPHVDTLTLEVELV